MWKIKPFIHLVLSLVQYIVESCDVDVPSSPVTAEQLQISAEVESMFSPTVFTEETNGTNFLHLETHSVTHKVK